MKKNVSVVHLIVATWSSGPPASGKIIKEMPGSVASGTLYTLMLSLWDEQNIASHQFVTDIFTYIYILLQNFSMQKVLTKYEHINTYDDILSKQLTEYNQDKYNKAYIL